MNDGRATVIVILLPGYPHGLKLVNEREDGSTEPARMLAIRGRIDFGAHWGGGEGLNFLLHALLHTLEHGAATCEDDVFEEILLNVVIAFHNRFKCVLVDALNVLIELLGGLVRLEQYLRAPKPFLLQIQWLISGQHILPLNMRLFLCRLHLSIIILRHYAHALLDVPDDLHCIGGVLY